MKTPGVIEVTRNLMLDAASADSEEVWKEFGTHLDAVWDDGKDDEFFIKVGGRKFMVVVSEI